MRLEVKISYFQEVDEESVFMMKELSPDKITETLKGYKKDVEKTIACNFAGKEIKIEVELIEEKN